MIEGNDSLYSRLGREPAVVALVDVFYQNVMSDNSLAVFLRMFPWINLEICKRSSLVLRSVGRGSFQTANCCMYIRARTSRRLISKRL
ncbi:MAG: hypothetical protein ACI9SX_001387 [Pseudoalteromonas tetraodonis]|jgi:hypothetical protein